MRAARAGAATIWTTVEVLPKFEHFGGTKARLGLALTIAYDELAKLA